MHADADEKIGGVVPPYFLSAGLVQELHSALTRGVAAEIAEPLVEFEARLLLEGPLQMSLRVPLSASLGQEFGGERWRGRREPPMRDRQCCRAQYPPRPPSRPPHDNRQSPSCVSRCRSIAQARPKGLVVLVHCCSGRIELAEQGWIPFDELHDHLDQSIDAFFLQVTTNTVKHAGAVQLAGGNVIRLLHGGHHVLAKAPILERPTGTFAVN